MKENKNYKISIITVVKNSLSTIEKTIRSVINQDYKNIARAALRKNFDVNKSVLIFVFKFL